MYRFLCCLVAVCVLQCVHSFILDDNHDCPTNCSCSELTVYCQYNTLHGWPVSLQNADILRHLYLGNNPSLGNIPRGAFDSFQHSLTYLSLRNTGLTHVPPDIKHLQRLRDLIMSDNAIGDIEFSDDTFGTGQMPIERLGLQNTSLTTIPLALCSLRSLQSLELDENNITMISDEQAHCIKNVQRLSIRKCGMSRIPSSLRLLTNLSAMYLTGNPLRSIEHYDLNGLTNLYYLSVDNTSISYISPGAFQWTTSLHYLYLQGNNISGFPDALRLLYKISYINLSDNPVHCSCGMKWASDWMKNSTLAITGTCANHAVPIDTYIKTFLHRCPP